MLEVEFDEGVCEDVVGAGCDTVHVEGVDEEGGKRDVGVDLRSVLGRRVVTRCCEQFRRIWKRGFEFNLFVYNQT